MRTLALAATLAVGCGRAAPSPGGTAVGNAGGAGAVASPPDLRELRALLAPHAAARFTASAVERGCPAESSVGEYIAMLITNGEGGEPGDVHRLTGGCGEFPAAAAIAPVDPPADPAYWYCRIDAFTSDPAGESPWHYELRVRVRRADRAVDPVELGCPGTP